MKNKTTEHIRKKTSVDGLRYIIEKIENDEWKKEFSKMYNQCYIECVGENWRINYPDGSRAWPQVFMTKGWATRTLKWLQKHG